MSEFPQFDELKNRKVKLRHKEDIEPHEIFWDKIAKKEEQRNDISEKKFETLLPKKSVFFPLIISIFLCFVFFARVVQLQVVDGAAFKNLAENNKYIFYKVQADRGIIFDRNFQPLVENKSTFDFVCDSTIGQKSDGEKRKILESMGKIVNLDTDKLGEKLADPREPITKNLDHQTLIVLEARQAEFPGCQIAKRPIREYAGDESLSQVLGYMGKIDQNEWAAQKDVYSINDYVGRSGLEKSYEEVLRKNPGQMRVERDAKGSVVSQEQASLPESGNSIVLWLDLDLQKKIEQELVAQLKNLGLNKASAVAIDPKTGGILAMVSLPMYDNNAFSQGNADQIQSYLNDKQQPLFNRAISGQYLTGSTIKPLTASAALQEKLINPEKKIDCKGGLEIKDAYNPDKTWWIPDNHVHGPTDMRKAIAESCNAYFQTIGGGYGDQPGLGPTRIKKYLEQFGWGSVTGIDLPGEAKGFIPSPDWKKTYFSGKQDQVWTDGDTYNMAIGQGFIGITPLQVANSFAAIANNGTLYQPEVVRRVVDAKRNVVEEKKPQVLRQNFIDAANLQVVREGMRQGVTGKNSPLASSVILNPLPVAVAAKTGTAQLRKDANGKDIMNSWVTVFAPYDDPQIVITIMMEDVHEGQLAVLPVAKNVLQWYFGPKDQGTAQPTTDLQPAPEGTSVPGNVPASPAATEPNPVVPDTAPAKPVN